MPRSEAGRHSGSELVHRIGGGTAARCYAAGRRRRRLHFHKEKGISVRPRLLLLMFGRIGWMVGVVVDDRKQIVSPTVGTDGANLSHFWRANNLVEYRNFEKCSRIPKDHALG